MLVKFTMNRNINATMRSLVFIVVYTQSLLLGDRFKSMTDLIESLFAFCLFASLFLEMNLETMNG